MSLVKEIAAQLLPHFSQSVLAKAPHTYGYYAKLIGRDPAKEAITIGPAMHCIGALCIICQIPVAPLYYVYGADKEARQVFSSDALEATVVLPHFETLFVTAREYNYSQSEFDVVAKALAKVVAKHDWGPHFMWHAVVANRPKGLDQTYFERALQKYEVMLKEMKANRKKKRNSAG